MRRLDQEQAWILVEIADRLLEEVASRCVVCLLYTSDAADE